jgi:hypothetical protein
MNANANWNVVERKMLELRILTNANWKKGEYELAVLGEKMLRGLEAAKGQTENACSLLERLPVSISELRDPGKLQQFLDSQAVESLN